MAKFITGPEIIEQINASKATYCHYVDEEHAIPTVTILSLDIIDQAFMDAAMKKLFKQRHRSVRAYKPGMIREDEVIIRVMTEEHIDREVASKRRNKDMLNFPPFKHYIKTDDGFKEVLRSHWADGFDNGRFCMDQGRLTKELARMIGMMVDKYGRRANWRGYSYLDEMSSTAIAQLCQSILKFNESKTENSFAYISTIMQNCFRKELAAQKKQQGIKDDLIFQHGMLGSHASQMNVVESVPEPCVNIDKNSELFKKYSQQYNTKV